MSKSHTKFQRQAESAQRFANSVRDIALSVESLANQHTKNDFSDCASNIFDADENPDGYVNVAPNGNINGLEFTPAQYLNIINFALQFRAMLDNGSVPSGDYRSSIEQVANPK